MTKIYGSTDIHFTQYLLPNGRKVEVYIDRPAPVALKAERLLADGYRFECEILTTGHVSLTIVGTPPDEDEEIDVAIKVVPNGPEVPAAIDQMILGFDAPQETRE